MTYYKRTKLFIAFTLLLFIKSVSAQEVNASSDELFKQARHEAIENKNYPKAILLLKQALQKSPDYTDLKIYLGRIYTWTDKLDSARNQFSQVLAADPKHAEALSANFDLEYWNNNYTKALNIAETGIQFHPDVAEFSIKKAKVLNETQSADKAIAFIKDYVKKHPNQEEAIKYYTDLKQSHTKNTIGTSYEYVYFDKRFTDAWHYVDLDYAHNFSFGSVSTRLNYANRFNSKGLQAEIEAYPSISKNIYAYVGSAYSSASIFPAFRFGTSLYYTLPKSFDAETGFRFLNFTPSKTYIFVLGAGKYIGNYYINIKSYLTPSEERLSRSFTLSTKYYFSDRFNFIGAQIGTGVSPDDRARNITGIGDLKSYKFGLNFSRDLIKNFTLGLSGLWYYEEYATNTWGNQISGGLSLSKRF